MEFSLFCAANVVPVFCNLLTITEFHTHFGFGHCKKKKNNIFLGQSKLH